MKITSFNPLIVTKKAAECQELFEALGFEKRHDTPSGVDESIHTVRMKDANGFHVDITGFDQLPQVSVITKPRFSSFFTVKVLLPDFHVLWCGTMPHGSLLRWWY